LGEPTAQATARRIPDAHVLDHLTGMDSALIQVSKGF